MWHFGKIGGDNFTGQSAEKISDAAQVHRYTGVAPSVAIHIPWDKVDDYGKLAAHAAAEGVRIGVVNPNTFQEDEYRLGSLWGLLITVVATT